MGFKDSFIANLLRIIQRMNPAMRQKQTATETKGPLTGGELKTNDPSVKKILCPALGLPDQQIEREYEEPAQEYKPSKPVESSSRDDRKNKKSRSRSRSPYQKKKKHRSRTRSRSRDRRHRSSRSRSRDRSRRSRSRDNRRDRRREDSRDRKSSRSDKHDRHPSGPTSSSKSDDPVVGEVATCFIKKKLP